MKAARFSSGFYFSAIVCASVLAAVLLLTGCATCRDHPVACSVAGAIVAGSIAATVAANDHHHAHTLPDNRGPLVPPAGGQR